jgi:hypothetical protein
VTLIFVNVGPMAWPGRKSLSSPVVIQPGCVDPPLRQVFAKSRHWPSFRRQGVPQRSLDLSVDVASVRRIRVRGRCPPPSKNVRPAPGPDGRHRPHAVDGGPLAMGASVVLRVRRAAGANHPAEPRWARQGRAPRQPLLRPVRGQFRRGRLADLAFVDGVRRTRDRRGGCSGVRRRP